MISRCIILIALLLLAAAPNCLVHAKGDTAAGKAKSGMCAGCHGEDGISSSPVFPNHRGQNAQYFIKQLTAFKDGSRKDPIMTGKAKSLSNQDIEDLAAYYSSLPCK